MFRKTGRPGPAAGLYRQGRGAFTMELLGGEISGNMAEGSYGGGVYITARPTPII